RGRCSRAEPAARPTTHAAQTEGSHDNSIRPAPATRRALRPTPAHGRTPGSRRLLAQPPTKPKTTVIVSIVAVVVLVLGTLGITGFVAPGFFLSDDKETTAAPVAEKTVESTEPEEPSEDASSPEIVADRIIMALKEGDVGALENLMCPDAKEKLKGVVGETDADSVDLVGEIRQVNEDEAKFDMTLTMSGAPFSAYAR